MSTEADFLTPAGLLEYPTATLVASSELRFSHGHLFGCQGGCDLPIHSCAEARRAALMDLREKVEGMDAFHPHEAPYVGGDASIPCNPKSCAGGMRRMILTEIDRALGE